MPVGQKTGLEDVWYHGSTEQFDTLRENSTVTRQRGLAEAFSHAPGQVEQEHDGGIRHNGTRPGYLYVVDEPVEIGKDLMAHPRSTMEPGSEYRTTRPLRVRLLEQTGLPAASEADRPREDRNASSGFFARVLRMKYINRWGLMRNVHPESLSVHTMDVAMLAHALAVLGNRRLGRHYVASRVAVLALYHDVSEILTGDMPTPVKYHDERITAAYKQIEREANRTLCGMLPDDLREEYRSFFEKQPEDAELWRLVKAADKLSALIKCTEEEKSGNREFTQAREATLSALRRMELPEAELFLEEFFPAFEKSLDQLDGD